MKPYPLNIKGSVINGSVMSGVDRVYQRLELIIKTTERCNLACPYCYYFFGGDATFEKRPPVIKPNVYEKLVERVEALIANNAALKELHMVFHGGEPMLQKADAFEKMIRLFRSRLGPLIKMRFSIQTNGTLINKRWAELFKEFNVFVGLSMDGPQLLHDKYRIDHKGKGTYSQTVEGLRLLQEEEGIGLSVISVIDHTYDYSEIIAHLHQSLGFKNFSFLLPDRTCNDAPLTEEERRGFSRALVAIFDYALNHDDVAVSHIDEMLEYLKLKNNALMRPFYFLNDSSKSDGIHNQVMVINSNGDMRVNDTLIMSEPYYSSLSVGNIFRQSIGEFLNSSNFVRLDSAYAGVAEQCEDCIWYRICRGGEFEHRFDSANEFQNPSAYCEVYQVYYEHCAKAMVDGGYPKEQLWEKVRPLSVSLHQ